MANINCKMYRESCTYRIGFLDEVEKLNVLFWKRPIIQGKWVMNRDVESIVWLL